jgi:hypothetical protein
MVGKVGNLVTYFLVTIAMVSLGHWLTISEVMITIAGMIVVGTIVGLPCLIWRRNQNPSMIGKFLEQSILITMVFGTLGFNLMLLWQ